MNNDKICKDYFGKTLAEMDDAEVCKHYVAYDRMVGGECCGTNDVALLSILNNELGKRDIDLIDDRHYTFIDNKGNEVEV